MSSRIQPLQARGRRLRRHFIPEFVEQSADGESVRERAGPDFDQRALPIPRSSPMRSAAFSPRPVNTTTVD